MSSDFWPVLYFCITTGQLHTNIALLCQDFLKLRPNDLMLWHALRWGCENGYQVFDWGRTDLGNDGLRNFKRGWGSEERLLHYTVFADQPPTHKPLRDNYKHLLQTVIQHSPLWVCRLAGELFYVHSA